MKEIITLLTPHIKIHLPCEADDLLEDIGAWVRDCGHCTDAVNDLNAFFNQLIIDRYREVPAAERVRFHRSVLCARRALGPIETARELSAWAHNLGQRYFPTLARLL